MRRRTSIVTMQKWVLKNKTGSTDTAHVHIHDQNDRSCNFSRPVIVINDYLYILFVTL